MRIKTITVSNFRLLENVTINLEDDVTLIVGKNNTGKTSLFEAIRIATCTERQLMFEDFSQKSYAKFNETYSYYQRSLDSDLSEVEKEELENKVRTNIPKISVEFEIEYDKEKDSLNELSEFISDLDEARNDATIRIVYEPLNSLKLFSDFETREDQDKSLIQYLKEKSKSLYKVKCYAIDKESSHRREIGNSYCTMLEKVVLFEEIKAMRVLDDTNKDSKRTLAKAFANYYIQRDKNNDNVLALENALEHISFEIRNRYKSILESILNQLKDFGGQTPIAIPEITIESLFDSEKIMSNNIHYFYKQEEINLPESYNGLGYSNLIYMIMELSTFIEKFKNAKEEKLSNFLVVLIEEPEAHMHPQMQQLFIKQITKLVDEAVGLGLNVQLVMTTHSSHILSESGIDPRKGFNRVRYFNRKVKEIDNKTIIDVEVQDFNNFKTENDKRTFRFLKQYMTLHKADMFFADKVIMVEGTTERMLVPLMINKAAPKLNNEYVTILVVGGAYSHIFKELLEFLGVRTLVITDIDSAKYNEGSNKLTKCPVAEGIETTNATLKKWIPGYTNLDKLVSCPENEKIQGNIRVVYQVKENGFSPRSFEDAFICCNKDFLLSKVRIDEETEITIKNEFLLLKHNDLSEIPAPPESKAKTTFAFDIMMFDEKEFGKEWQVPKYILDGLTWLENNE